MDESLAVLAAQSSFRGALVGDALDKVERALTSDFRLTHATSGAVQDKASFLAALKSGGRFLELEFEDIEVLLYERTAVILGRGRSVAESRGQQVTVLYRFTQTWIQAGDDWQLAAWQSTLLPIEVGG